MFTENHGTNAVMYALTYLGPVALKSISLCILKHLLLYHVLWVSKVYESFKMRFLRDHRRKIADLCLDISPMYYSTVDHKRNEKNLLCLCCNLANNVG